VQPEAEDEPVAEDDDERHQVPEKVTEHVPEQRRGPRDRQAPEPVEDAVAEVGVEADGRAHRREHQRLHGHAGQDELQVRVPVAGHRGAEQEHEQRDEHDRAEGQVEQLLGRVLDAQHGAPGEPQTVPDELHRATPVNARNTSSRLARRRPSSLTAIAALSSR
jgi:hypothetical protein